MNTRPRLRLLRRLRRKSNSPRYSARCSASTATRYLRSRVRLIYANGRCTAGSASCAGLPDAEMFSGSWLYPASAGGYPFHASEATVEPGSACRGMNSRSESADALSATASHARPQAWGAISIAPATCTFPAAPRPALPGRGPPMKVSSTSTRPDSRPLSALPMTWRSLASMDQAVWCEPIGSTRCSYAAETPLLLVDISQSASNHTHQWDPRLVENRPSGHRYAPAATAASIPAAITAGSVAAAVRADGPVWPGHQSR